MWDASESLISTLMDTMTTQELTDYFDQNEDDIMGVIPYPFPDDFKAVVAEFYLKKIDQLMENNFG